MFPSGKEYALTLLLSGHQRLGSGLHQTALTLVWVLLFLEDLQGTSDFRLLWGSVSTLCLGEGLWTLFLLCPTLSASPAFLSHRSDLYSCLPIPGED